MKCNYIFFKAKNAWYSVNPLTEIRTSWRKYFFSFSVLLEERWHPWKSQSKKLKEIGTGMQSILTPRLVNINKKRLSATEAGKFWQEVKEEHLVPGCLMPILYWAFSNLRLWEEYTKEYTSQWIKALESEIRSLTIYDQNWKKINFKCI